MPWMNRPGTVGAGKRSPNTCDVWVDDGDETEMLGQGWSMSVRADPTNRAAGSVAMVAPCHATYNHRRVRRGESLEIKSSDVEAHKAAGWALVDEPAEQDEDDGQEVDPQ